MALGASPRERAEAACRLSGNYKVCLSARALDPWAPGLCDGERRRVTGGPLACCDISLASGPTSRASTLPSLEREALVKRSRDCYGATVTTDISVI